MKMPPNLVQLIAKTRLPNGAVFATWVIKLPAFLDGEFRTHRQQSKSAASFRARTTKSMIDDIVRDPFVRWHWTLNEPGMQGHTTADDVRAASARREWMYASAHAVASTKALLALGLHKQDCNRLLQPFSWMQYIVTSRDIHLDHWRALRDHPMAEPHFRDITREALRLFDEAVAVDDVLHAPYVGADERKEHAADECALISATRCRRVSLFRVGDTTRSDAYDDIASARDMSNERPMHATPFEHQVWFDRSIIDFANLAGNLAAIDDAGMPIRDGTVQHRKIFFGEYTSSPVKGGSHGTVRH
jgi:hypothetical protein